MTDDRNAWILFGLIVLLVGLINEVMFGWWTIITEWAQGNWHFILFTAIVTPFIIYELMKQYKFLKEKKKLNK